MAVESLKFHLEIYSDDMLLVTYKAVSSRFDDLALQIIEDKYNSVDDIHETIKCVDDYISWLVHHHTFSRQYPPYNDLEENINKSEKLLEFLIYLNEGSFDHIVDKCRRNIERAKCLEFPFNYRKWKKQCSFESGDVVLLDMAESMEVNFFQLGELHYCQDFSIHKSIYLRIGQTAPITKMFEFVYLSGHPFGELTLYEHKDSETVKITSFETSFFWVYRNDEKTPQYSVYTKELKSMVIGNVGSESGIYLQNGLNNHRNPSPMPGK